MSEELQSKELNMLHINQKQKYYFDVKIEHKIRVKMLSSSSQGVRSMQFQKLFIS